MMENFPRLNIIYKLWVCFVIFGTIIRKICTNGAQRQLGIELK